MFEFTIMAFFYLCYRFSINQFYVKSLFMFSFDEHKADCHYGPLSSSIFCDRDIFVHHPEMTAFALIIIFEKIKITNDECYKILMKVNQIQSGTSDGTGGCFLGFGSAHQRDGAQSCSTRHYPVLLLYYKL